MEVRWLTAFIDRRPDSIESAAEFWSTVTDSTISPWRGPDREFATFQPAHGDPHLRLQRLAEGDNGVHLDLHVDDVRAASTHAIACGAQRVPNPSGVATLRSPGGLTFCIVTHRGESVFSAGRRIGDVDFVADQLCIDVPAARWPVERRFWEQLTGWTLARSAAYPELGWLAPDWPADRRALRLIMQRTGAEASAVGCHVDIAANDVPAVVSYMVSIGATEEAVLEGWTVMRDPGGVEFCVTGRDPATGRSTARPRWVTDDDLAAAWVRFAAVLPDYRPPSAYTVCRQADSGALSFGHLNAPGGQHLLPAAVLSVVTEHAHGTATCALSRSQITEAIRILEPAEAATHVEHPNLWSWRTLLADAAPESRFWAVFVDDLDDDVTSPADADFRTQLASAP
ncbi:MAG: VOC family protein [Actinomycetota bacterium]